MKLSVMMPVYNESRTLRTIVERVLKAPVDMDIELVCVNDGSTDRSLEVLRQLASEDERIVVVDQTQNLGKGMAIRTAIRHVTGDIAIVQDADLEYDPNDYPLLVAPIRDNIADAVYGSRFAVSELRRVLFFWHAFGNRILTTLSNMANDLNLTDMETCYKAIRVDLLKRLRLTSDRFGFEPEVTARLAQWGARIYEVPISYHGRTYAEGKNIGWRDGVEAFLLILKFKFLDTRATDDDSVVTRQSLGKAPRFRKWVLDGFAGYMGSRVLEVNSGPGHTTAHLLDKDQLTATDSDPVHVETLRRRFGHLENLTIRVDDYESSSSSSATFDTAVILDGLQRASDPQAFLENISAHIVPGGHLLIQVPAGPSKFSELDEALGHRRRFSKADLLELLDAASLEVISIHDFNRLGSLGWSSYKRRRKIRVGFASARLYDLGVPLLRRFDALLPVEGLSWQVVARKV